MNKQKKTHGTTYIFDPRNKLSKVQTEEDKPVNTKFILLIKNQEKLLEEKIFSASGKYTNYGFLPPNMATH